MNKKLKVSVIIPVYNVEEHIEKCLLSAINQTLREIEIIVVNDATPDNSMEIVKRYQQLDDRIKVLNHNKNKGLALSRNTGIENACAEYICFLDSDDWIDENALELIYYKIKGSDAQFLEFNFRAIYKSGEVVLYSEITEEAIVNKIDWLDGFSKGKYKDVVWNKIYNADFIKKNNLLFDNVYCSEDTAFCLRAYRCAQKISSSTDILYNYRQREQSLAEQMNKSPEFRNVQSQLKRLNIITELLEGEGLLQSEICKRIVKAYLSQCKKAIYNYSLKLFDTDEFESDILRCAREDINGHYSFVYILMEEIFNVDKDKNIIEYFEMENMDINRFEDWMRVQKLVNCGAFRADDKILIYGTGNWGKYFYHALSNKKVNIIAFVDSNEQKWGSKFYSLDIIAPAKIKKMDFTKVVIASSAHGQIKMYLQELGIEEAKITEFDL